MSQFPSINQVVFKDFDTLFDIHPVTRKLNILTNEVAVARSVKNLVLTNKGERPYQPFLGCDVRNRLFELDDGFTEEEIVENIQEVIAEYEPRAELLDVIAGNTGKSTSINMMHSAWQSKDVNAVEGDNNSDTKRSNTFR